MGLWTTYGDMNKVTSRGLAVRYSVQPAAIGYEVTRYATKSYAFVGMDRATAKSCASAKRSQYTREYSRVKTKSGTSGSTVAEVTVVECPCDIAETPQGGGMWQVQISVNETDAKPSAEIPSDPASLFTAANGRNYDEGEGDGGGKPLLVLNSVARYLSTQAAVSYSTSIEGFVEAALVLQYKTSESGSWNTARRDSNGMFLRVPSPDVSADCWCRLMYGSVESNTVKA